MISSEAPSFAAEAPVKCEGVREDSVGSDKSDGEEEEVCPICLNELDEGEDLLVCSGCHNQLHQHCMDICELLSRGLTCSDVVSRMGNSPS